MKKQGIGKIAISISISDEDNKLDLINKFSNKGYVILTGQVGSMDSKNIIAAIETAAMRKDFIRENYREEHALYHATMEAFTGYCRGHVELGEVLRSTGLVYTLVRGNLIGGDKSSGDWLAVVLYGEIGSPRQGFEHEAIGMGVQPV